VPVVISNSGSEDYLDITIQCLNATWKTGVNIVLYRTSNSGSVYRRLTTLNNVQSARHIIYSDLYADSALGDEPVYITDGTIENIAPPSGNVQAFIQNRHFIVDGGFPGKMIRYSKPIKHNTGIEHSDYFIINIPGHGGNIQGIASIDNKIIVIKEKAVFAIIGDLVDEYGRGENYAKLEISNECGAYGREGFTECEQGVMLADYSGMFLIDKNLQISNTGLELKAHYSDIISSSVFLYYDRGNKRVLLSSQNKGKAYVFNETYKKWTSYKFGVNVFDICALGENLYVLNYSSMASYRIFKLDKAKFYAGEIDDENKMVVETGWINVTDVGGTQRIYKVLFLCQNHGSSGVGVSPVGNQTLRVQAQFDYEPVWLDAQVNSSTESTSYFVPSYLEETPPVKNKARILEARFSKQQCTSFRVRIMDVLSTANSGTWSISAIMAEVGIRRNVFKNSRRTS
jgi:hypothetical protein